MKHFSKRYERNYVKTIQIKVVRLLFYYDKGSNQSDSFYFSNFQPAIVLKFFYTTRKYTSTINKIIQILILKQSFLS